MDNLGFNLGYVAVISKDMEIQIYIYCFDIAFKLDISVILFWESNFCQKEFFSCYIFWIWMFINDR